MHGVTDLQRKVNVLMCNFKFTNSDVLNCLFKTYCMPLYGSVLWDLTDTNCERFYTAWRKAIRRVWKISPQTHCVLLPLICDDKPIEVQMCNRFLKFYQSLIKSDNSTIKVLLRHAIDGSGSSVANSINLLWHRYNINKFNFHLREEKRGALQDPSTPEEDLIRTARTINEFVSLRDSLPISNIDRANDSSLRRSDVQDIITYLCTV